MSHEKPSAPNPEHNKENKEHKIPSLKKEAEQDVKNLKAFLTASKSKTSQEFYEDLLKDGKKTLSEEKEKLALAQKLKKAGVVGADEWLAHATKRVVEAEDGIRKYEKNKDWIVANKNAYIDFLEKAVIAQKEYLASQEDAKEKIKNMGLKKPDFLKDAKVPPVVPEKSKHADNHGHDNHGGHGDKKPEGKKEVFARRGAVVDTTAMLEAQARDDANHRMTESKEDRDQGRVKRWFNRMWKHNIAQDYYQQKYTVEARKNILANKNLYANEGGGPGNKRQYQEAMEAVHERFISDYKNELLKQGESYEVIGERPEINSLIKRYGAGGMTDAAFETEKTRILSTVRQEYADKEKLYTDNLLQYAQELRDSCQHGKNINDMDVHVEITLGKAKERLNTEAKLRGFERCWDKLKKARVGKIFGNEAAASLIGAAVYSAGKFFGLKALRSKVGQWMTFGGTAVAAGAIVGLNESRRLEQERSQHSRDRARGMMFQGDDLKRREHMEQFMYQNMRYANDVIANLEQYPPDRIENGMVSPQSLQIAFDNLVDLEARFRLGQERKIDLIRYSDPRQLEIESTNLDILRAELKCAMRRRYAATTGNPHYFDEHFNSGINNQITHLLKNEGGIEQTDKCFKKMKLRRAAMRGLSATIIGGAVGAVAQEAYHSFLPTNTDSLSSGLWHSHHGQPLHQQATPLESLHRWWTGNNPRVSTGTPHFVPCGHTQLQVPEGVDLHENADGTFSIINGDQHLDNVPLMFDSATGDLTEESKQLLAGHDIYTDMPPVSEHVHESAYEYIKNHSHGTTRMHRHEWEDNDTAAFDHNELRTYWGGVNGTGVDANGDYVLDVSHMTSGGSWHGAHDIDALQKMQNGELKMAFSLSRDTQHDTFQVPVGPDGLVHIPANSEIGQRMMEQVSGHAHFTGKFMEVVTPTGEVAKDGGEIVDVLSSLKSGGHDMIDFDSSIHTIRFSMPDTTDTDMIPPLYMYAGARRPLEKGGFIKNAPEPVATPHDHGHDDGHGHGDHDHGDHGHGGGHDDHGNGTPAEKHAPVAQKTEGATHENPTHHEEVNENVEPENTELDPNANVIVTDPWDDSELLAKKEEGKDAAEPTAAEEVVKTPEDAKKDLEDAEKKLAGIEVVVAGGVPIAAEIIEAAKEKVAEAKEALKKAEGKKTAEEETADLVKDNRELKSRKFKALRDGDRVFFAGDRNVFATIDEKLDNGKIRFVYDDPKKHKEPFFDAAPLGLVYLASDIEKFKNKKAPTGTPAAVVVPVAPTVDESTTTTTPENVDLPVPPLPPLADLLKEQNRRALEKGFVSAPKPKNDYLGVSNILNGLPPGTIKPILYENFRKGQKYFVDGDKKRQATFLRKESDSIIRFQDIATGNWFRENVSNVNVYNMENVDAVLLKTDAQLRIEDAENNLSRLDSMNIVGWNALDRSTWDYAKTEYAKRLVTAEADRLKEIAAEEEAAKTSKEPKAATRTRLEPAPVPKGPIRSSAETERIFNSDKAAFTQLVKADFNNLTKGDKIYIRDLQTPDGSKNQILTFEEVDKSGMLSFTNPNRTPRLIFKKDLGKKVEAYPMTAFDTYTKAEPKPITAFTMESALGAPMPTLENDARTEQLVAFLQERLTRNENNGKTLTPADITRINKKLEDIEDAKKKLKTA